MRDIGRQACCQVAMMQSSRQSHRILLTTRSESVSEEFVVDPSLTRQVVKIRLYFSKRLPGLSKCIATWSSRITSEQNLMRFHTSLALIFLISPWVAMAQENLEPKEVAIDPTKLFEPREFSDEGGKVLQYRLLKPLDYDPGEKYPLVIFLHGAGERGDDNVAQLKHGMKEFCTQDRREDYRCYVLAPQCPSEQKWADVDWTQSDVEFPASISDSLKLTLQVVDSMVKDAAIDKNRIYITGLSMGGYGTWDALVRRPDFFAAALPICGGADPKTAESIKHVPIACFHGGADSVVIPEKSRIMIEALKKAGGEPLYTEYEGVGHDSWSATYANEDSFRWLFAQRKRAQDAQEVESTRDN
jgi:predicted peptidase